MRIRERTNRKGLEYGIAAMNRNRDGSKMTFLFMGTAFFGRRSLGRLFLGGALGAFGTDLLPFRNGDTANDANISCHKYSLDR